MRTPLLLASCVAHALELQLVDHAPSWAAAGLASRFASVYESALPPALADEVLAAVRTLQLPPTRRTAGGQMAEHSWWMPLYDGDRQRAAPRSVIEAAIHLLVDVAFRGEGGATAVVGAEWWARRQETSGGMAMHYDKDESSHDDRDLLRHPELSTVMYLSNAGAPTLVLNQSLGWGAEEMEPPLAGEAMLIQPRRNRFVVFRGNLHHGVASELTAAPPGSAGSQRVVSEADSQRVVLLINWWRSPPPTGLRCVESDEAVWRSLGLLRDAAALRALAADGAAERRPLAAPGRWRVAAESGGDEEAVADTRRRWVVFEVGDGIVFHYPFPQAEALEGGMDSGGSTEGSGMDGRGVWLFEWDDGAAVGPLTMLTASAVAAIDEEEDGVNLFLILRAGQLPRWLPALHPRLYGAVRIVLVDPTTDPSLLRRYDLPSPTALPTAVLRDAGSHFRLAPGEALSEAAVEGLLGDAGIRLLPQLPPAQHEEGGGQHGAGSGTRGEAPSCDAAASVPASVPAVLLLPDIPPALRSADALRDTDWLRRGIDHHAAGRLSLAVQHFAVAAHVISWGGPVWGNLGFALTDLAAESTLASGGSGERVSLLCEAAIAIELGILLGAEAEAAGRDETLAALAAAAGGTGGCASAAGSVDGSCIAAACGGWLGGEGAVARFEAARRALQLSHGPGPPAGGGGGGGMGGAQQRHLQAVDMLCAPASVQRTTVALREHERSRQVLGAATAYQAWALFRTCGVVALDGALSLRAVERARDAVRQRLEASMDTITKYREGRQQGKVGGTPLEEEALASRDQSGSDLRYELKVGAGDTAAFVGEGEAGTAGGDSGGGGSAGGAVDSELILALTKLLLHGNALAIDTLSAVVSLPGCPLGHWHADVDDPRDGAASLVGDARHGPPPGLVAIVPLINLTSSNGPTQFLLGSHVELGRGGDASGGDGWWATRHAMGDASLRRLELPLEAAEGSVVLFDLRIRHRGGANTSPDPRPILYCGYAMRWFTDAVNFKDVHTREWDALPSRTRRALLSRLDSRAYTRRLEEELRARGVDVAAMQSASAAEYKATSLVV